MAENPAERARFHAMVDATPDDWNKIRAASLIHVQNLPRRVLQHLRSMAGHHNGFAVDLLQHSLQSATLAHRDGMDEEYVVCALLHDVGELLSSLSHPDMAAAMLAPFISRENLWMLKHHGEFQGYYFFHQFGLDRNFREKYRGHPCFERTAMFCARHDQNAFNPNYDAMPIEAFVPMVWRVMSSPKGSVAAAQNTEQTTA